MSDTTSCHECGAPAQITSRFHLDSTDGPVEHVKVGCSNNHWFTMPAEMLEPTRSAAHIGLAASRA
jgi:hypothetical protein